MNSYVPPHKRNASNNLNKNKNNNSNSMKNDFPSLGSSNNVVNNEKKNDYSALFKKNQKTKKSKKKSNNFGDNLPPGWISLKEFNKNKKIREAQELALKEEEKKLQEEIENSYSAEEIHYYINDLLGPLVNKWEQEKWEEYQRNGYVEFDEVIVNNESDYEPMEESSDSESDYEIDSDGEPFNDYDLLDNKKFLTI